MVFTDASPDLERRLASSGNCCVKFKSTDVSARRTAKERVGVMILALLLVICAMIIVMTVSKAVVEHAGGCRGRGCMTQFQGEVN